MMRRAALPARTTRVTRWVMPALLSLAAAGCGGGWVTVGYYDDGMGPHEHDHDQPPPKQPDPAPSGTGLFLFAGDVCQCEGALDGTGPSARLDGPAGITTDSRGNLFVAERNSSTIRKVTPQAVVTTVAGTAGTQGSSDGVGQGARFNGPTKLQVDRNGVLYVADAGNSTIRRVSPEGVVTTLAGTAGVCGSIDGIASRAQFCNPQGIALDQRGNLYVADTQNNTVRRIDAAGNVTTIAGTPGVCGSADGRGTAARFCQPQAIALDTLGYLYVADTANSTIRIISPRGDVSTLGGRPNDCGSADGNAVTSRFCRPADVEVDALGNLYVADTGNATIRKISTRGTVSTVAGVAGRNGTVLGPLPGGLDKPQGMAVTDRNTLVVTSNNLLLKLVATP